MMQRNLFRSCFPLFVAAFFALGATAPAYSQSNDLLYRLSFTGIWAEDPTPQGSSWGVNFAQSGNFIFATFYVYDESGKPTWYTGELSTVYTFPLPDNLFSCPDEPKSYVGNVGGTFRGSFYLTTSGPTTDMFSPSGATTTEVGKVAFVPETPTTGRLCVQIGDKLLTKNIKRLTLTHPPIGYSGRYASFGLMIKTMVFDDAAATFLGIHSPSSLSFQITEDGKLTLTFDDRDTHDLDSDYNYISDPLFNGMCTISGAASVDGPYYVAKNAAYRCKKNLTNTLDTTADVYLRFNMNGGMEGYWVSQVGGVNSMHGGYSDRASFSATYQPE